MVAAAAVAAGRPSAHAPKAQAQELQEEEEERPGAGGASPRAGSHRAASPGRQQPAPATALCSHTPNASDYELSLDLKNKQVPRASKGGMGRVVKGPCLRGLSRVPGISPLGPTSAVGTLLLPLVLPNGAKSSALPCGPVCQEPAFPRQGSRLSNASPLGSVFRALFLLPGAGGLNCSPHPLQTLRQVVHCSLGKPLPPPAA